MTNFPLPILLSIFFVVAVVVVFIVAVMVMTVAIIALVTLDTLTLSLVTQKIAIYPLSPRTMASTSTSTSTDTTAWVVHDFPPSLGSTMASSSRPGRRVGMVMGKRGMKGRRGLEN